MIRVNRMQAIREIGRLQGVLRDLGQVPRKIAELAAPRLTRLLQDEFRDGQDPYGRSWAPLKPSTLAQHGPPPLTGPTRTLRLGTVATVAPARRAGVRLRVGAPYGYFHQVGFRVGKTRVPPRRILPQYGIPAAWRAVLERSAREACRSATSRLRGR